MRCAREGPQAPVRVRRRARGRPARRAARAGGRHDAARAGRRGRDPAGRPRGRGRRGRCDRRGSRRRRRRRRPSPSRRPAAVRAAAGSVRGGAGPRTLGPRRSPRSHRPWLIAALVVALVVRPDRGAHRGDQRPLPSKPAVRQEARESRAGQRSQNTRPPDTPVTFANAWSGLISAIGSAKVGDDISDTPPRSSRRTRTSCSARTATATPTSWASRSSTSRSSSPRPSRRRRSHRDRGRCDRHAISDIVVALQNEGALAVVPTEAPTGPTGETGGSSQGGQARARRRTARPTGTKRTRARPRPAVRAPRRRSPERPRAAP